MDVGRTVLDSEGSCGQGSGPAAAKGDQLSGSPRCVDCDHLDAERVTPRASKEILPFVRKTMYLSISQGDITEKARLKADAHYGAYVY